MMLGGMAPIVALPTGTPSRRRLITPLLIALLFVNASVVYAESMDAGQAVGKLTRGAINVVTGWVEIPKRIRQTAQQSGPAVGITWGLLRGLGYGFIRTAAGCYELFTFPFPAPPGYAPVIEPPYVFTN